ncbi:beta transducin [Coemansia javaensis]|uniref:Beta transducin n=1 Tax=Coemansia javaensis TaxID=2761396 RepID=A0A9W8LKB0_9FUNG|nr:beta transducin [Coemansia javaensis]
MVKSYLRYEARGSFGVIASPSGNAVFDHSGRQSVTAALEDVIVWDVRKGTQTERWSDPDNRAEVTRIARSPRGRVYAVGYADGTIRLFEEGDGGAVKVVLSGHRGSVSALAFDATGTVLASGARDTDVIVWDVVGEVGLHRLRGHKDEVTGIAFLAHGAAGAVTAGAAGHIVTSSKDTLVKLWDLRAQHCVQTLVTHRSEVWALAASPDGRLLVTGTGEADLHVWTVDAAKLQQTAADGAADGWAAIAEYGSVRRTSGGGGGSGRVVALQFHPSGQYLACLGADRAAEVFRVRTPAEIRKKMARRQKRSREKKGQAGGAETAETAEQAAVGAADELTSFRVVRTGAKAASIDFDPSDAEPQAARRGSVRLLVAQGNNALHVWDVPVPPAGTTTKQAAVGEPAVACSVELAGHRTEPRALALSGDGELLVSAASRSLRVWSAATGACVRTLESGEGLCAAFLPGDQYVVVGTKAGALELYDIPAAALVETFDAHGGAACWAIDVAPDGKGLVTGGADKCVKFWSIELVRDQSHHHHHHQGAVSRRRMTLAHTKTLQMSDDVLAVRVSPDARLLAVALLDTTVKVFYADTLKFFLSLYGHRLPVVALDISSDSTLLVTGSADKSVKLWGLDFGDCHRSLLAHQEPVTAVRFVWGTHYFFSAGKDRVVQQWDGDSFQRIQKLGGSHGDVWALAVARHGAAVFAAGQDRAIRVWERTDEPVFLEEERERELEELYERGIEETLGQGQGQEDGDEGGGGDQRAGRSTMETLKAGERIMEAIDLADGERRKREEHAAQARRLGAGAGAGAGAAGPEPHPVLRVERLTAEAYVLREVERVRAADLDDALLVLGFGRVVSLLAYVDHWAQRGWNTPLTCRVLFFLLRTHQSQIVATRTMRARLHSIRAHLRAGVARQRDQVGFNVAALAALKADWEAAATASFFDDAAIQAVLDAQLKKRKFVGARA